MNWSNPELKWIALSPPPSLVIENSTQADLSILFNGGDISNDNPTKALLQQISDQSDNVWLVSGNNTPAGMAQIDALGKILNYKIKLEWEYMDKEHSTRLFLLTP